MPSIVSLSISWPRSLSQVTSGPQSAYFHNLRMFINLYLPHWCLSLPFLLQCQWTPSSSSIPPRLTRWLTSQRHSHLVIRPSQLILFGTIAGHRVWQLRRHLLPQLSHNFHNDDVELNVLGCQVDIFGTNCDQCVSMVQCCFTSTETVRLIRTESPGRPPLFSHSSWMLSTAFCWNTAFKAPSTSAVGSHYLLSPQMLKSILRTICRTIWSWI